MNQELEKKLAKWHESDEYDRVISEIRAIPEGERDYELWGQLARALNNIDEYEEAVEILLQTEEEGAEDPRWFYRMGYAQFGMEQYGEAREYFIQASELDPADMDAPAFIEMCSNHLAYPVKRRAFRDRVREFWKVFSEKEKELREKIDNKEKIEDAVEFVSQMLNIAFSEPCFEMGFNGQKHELILSAEGIYQRLFRMQYWKEHAPEALSDRWNFIVGRPACSGSGNWGVSMYDHCIAIEDAVVWIDKLKDKQVGLSIYCEKILPLLEEDEGKAYHLVSILIDQCMGEISAIRNIGYLDILDRKEAPEAGDGELVPEPMPISKLRDFVLEMHDGNVEQAEGISGAFQSFTAYRVEPKNEDCGLREDVFIGNSCCMQVINEFYRDCTDIVDENEKDGAIFGFLYYNNDQVPQEEMVPFRGEIEDELQARGKDCCQILGGATGNAYSYIDCICYDLAKFLDIAGEVLNQKDLEEIAFHVFRKDCGGVDLKEEEGSGIMTDELRNQVLQFSEEGQFHKALRLLTDLPGAEGDLEACLSIAYCLINIDEYDGYLDAVKWLAGVEEEGADSGIWNYRYSVALSYLGRFQEALQYAYQGTQAEPDYPWAYLQLAKMYYQAGKREEALQSIEAGLKLVPEDYEFCTLRTEIQKGMDMAHIMGHYVEPQPEEEESCGQHFQGFVLLNSMGIHMDGILEGLEADWGIVPDLEEDEEEIQTEDGDEEAVCSTKVFHVDGCMVAISLMPAPIPEGEAEYYAETNYMWPDAAAVVKTHEAHVLVAVMPGEQSMIDAGKLFVKVAASCLKADNAIAVYTSGTVFQPEFYIEVAELMEDEDALPILDWIYFGLYRGEKGNCAYTYGLTTFGKDEIEVLDSQRSLEELRDFLFQISCYIIEEDVTLLDGETIGFTADQKLTITRSEAVGVEGMSLKIGY